MVQFRDPGSGRADKAYFRAAMAEPLLDRVSELDLTRRWRECGDESALHRLVRAHGRMVVASAMRLRHYGLPIGDLVQEGNLGLLQAAARFEPERDLRFATYAAWWVRAAMQDHVLRNWSIVRTGSTTAQKALFFNLRRLRQRIERESGAPLSLEGRRQIAAAIGVPVSEVEAMEQRLASADQSLNAPLGEEGGGEVGDLFADPRPDPETVVIGTRDAAARSRWLAQALAELTPRERRIIAERRLAEEARTLDDIGRELGVSKERVRQIESGALSKLRRALLRRAGDAWGADAWGAEAG
ncbi:MAG: RNA polymerase factor sigma-32 [Thalassobaculales bacterium]